MFWQLDDKLKMFMTPGAVGEPDLKRGTVLFLLRKLKIHNVQYIIYELLIQTRIFFLFLPS